MLGSLHRNSEVMSPEPIAFHYSSAEWQGSKSAISCAVSTLRRMQAYVKKAERVSQLLASNIASSPLDRDEIQH